MGNLIKELSEKFNLQSSGQQAWGTVEGYWFQISPPVYGRNTLVIRTAAHQPDGAVESAVMDGLSAYVKGLPSVSYSRNGGTVTLERKMSFGGLKAEDAGDMLLQLAGLFRRAGAAPACFNCNSDRLDSFAMVNGTAMKLCADCQASISGRITQAAQEHAEKGNRVLPGSIGALIGALIGSIAWIVIGMLGFLAAIGGVAISFCAAKGYTMMKGKINVPAIVIICLISIVVMFAASFVSYDISIYNQIVKDAGTSVDFGLVTQLTYDAILNDSGVFGEFFGNCMLGLLFLGIGSWSIIRSLAVQAKAPAGTFERL